MFCMQCGSQYPEVTSFEIEGIGWSPDSTRVASAADDGTVRIWQAV